MRPSTVKLAAILTSAWLGIVAAHADPASIDRNRLLNAAAEPANWLAKGGDWRGEFVVEDAKARIAAALLYLHDTGVPLSGDAYRLAVTLADAA